MNPLIQFKKVTPVCLIVSALACFAFSSRAEAAPVPNPPGPGVLNTRDGQSAMPFVTTGIANSAFGAFSLFSVITGNFNTAVGVAALDLNTGDSNTAVGTAALLFNTGADNTGVGVNALGLNTTGASNVAVGNFALYNNVGGFGNVAVGDHAGEGLTTGIGNTVVGQNSGFNMGDGGGNIYIGTDINPAAPETGVVRIGNGEPPENGTTSKCFIGGITGKSVGADGVAVFVNGDGQLGTTLSSARFKKDIESMGKNSETIYSLKPVTFHYKGDETKLPCFGLIAEEVAKVNPGLIVMDKEGKALTVRYEQINAMLLNEFLKEHRTVEEQECTIREQDATIAEVKSNAARQGVTIARLQQQIEALTEGLQKVSAQLEVSKPAPRTVLNNQ